MAFENKKIGEKIYELRDGQIEILTIDGIRFPKDRPKMVQIFVGGERPLVFYKSSKSDTDHNRPEYRPEYRYYSNLNEAQKRKKLDIQHLIHLEMGQILPRLRRLKKLHGGNLALVRKRVYQLFNMAEEEKEEKS